MMIPQGSHPAVCLLSILTIQLVHGKPASAPDPPLLAIPDDTGDDIWRNEGGLDRILVKVYEARRRSAETVVLGQAAQDNWESLKNPTHAWRDVSSKKDALSRPLGFQFVWDTKKGLYFEGATLWRPTCPKGYVALADFFHKDVGVDPPAQELFNKVRCIQEQLTEACLSWGVKIWDNQGSVSSYDGSIWRKDPDIKTAVYAGYFYGNNKHNERPKVQPRCLKKTAYVIQQ